MAKLTGLFLRGGAYYLRVVLPQSHPLTATLPSGRLVRVLGAIPYRAAVRKGTILRASVLGDHQGTPLALVPPGHRDQEAPMQATSLRDIYDRWLQSKPLTPDSVAACGRAVGLFEQQTGNTPLQLLTRSQGDAFRAWLQTLPTTSKTARDRLNWIKSLLKYAAQELEVIPKSPWVGLDIKSKTTVRRHPWSDAELVTLFSHPIWQTGQVPQDTKAGGAAAYWIPLLALYTGARCSELCQLTVSNVAEQAGVAVLTITDEGAGQQVKSAAGIRVVPVHHELIRLGFMRYARSVAGPSLWPSLPQRAGKPGGYFSQFFGQLRRDLGIPPQTVFHSFRHSVRTRLAEAGVAELIIDRILGHESGGSVGARVYTHVPICTLQSAINTLSYAACRLAPLRMAPAIAAPQRGLRA